VVIYGASGHGLVIRDLLSQNGIKHWQFVDDDPKQGWYGEFVKHPTSANLHKDVKAILVVRNYHIRKELSIRYNLDYQKIAHPSVIHSLPSNHIGIGTVMMAVVVINPDVRIGRHCILNTGVCVDHECRIEDYVHLSPNATLCGNVQVGEGSHIGAGAVVIHGIRIGKWATVGAGAVVIKDVPDFAVVVGNPAKILRVNPSF
jgi:acetyltransferase EpsM